MLKSQGKRSRVTIPSAAFFKGILLRLMQVSFLKMVGIVCFFGPLMRLRRSRTGHCRCEKDVSARMHAAAAERKRGREN